MFHLRFFLVAIKECLERDLKEIQSKLDYINMLSDIKNTLSKTFNNIQC